MISDQYKVLVDIDFQCFTIIQTDSPNIITDSPKVKLSPILILSQITITDMTVT